MVKQLKIGKGKTHRLIKTVETVNGETVNGQNGKWLNAKRKTAKQTILIN